MCGEPKQSYVQKTEATKHYIGNSQMNEKTKQNKTVKLLVLGTET